MTEPQSQPKSLIQMSQPRKARRYCIYGQPGLGKTSLALSFPKPLIFDVEDGIPDNIQVPRIPVNNYQDISSGLKELEANNYDIKTIVIDSLDRLEPMIAKQICIEKGWSSLGQGQFAEGWTENLARWGALLKILNRLQQRGIDIILISHSIVKTITHPLHGVYDKNKLRLNEKVQDLIEGDTDVILYIDLDISIKTEKSGFKEMKSGIGDNSVRCIYSTPSPAYTAKNRCGIPPKLQYAQGEGYKTLQPYIHKDLAPTPEVQ